jgi:hypothetical protein
MLGRLQNGYFVDGATGLAWKLNLLAMGSLGNDLKKVNDEVDRRNGLFANEAEDCLTTVGFHLPVCK